MKIADIALYKYELPLVKPLAIKGHVINSRCGIIISLTDEDGFVGLGDAAPLPGLHNESLEDAIEELMKIMKAKKLSGIALPSVRVATEGAMLDLTIQKDKAFDGIEKLRIPVNALLFGDAGEVVTEFKGLCDAGFHAIKIKVGWRNITEDIELVRSLKELNRDVTLRLDANRAWELDEALEFCTQVGAEQIEYIEEPVADANDHAEFIKASPIPLALDETLAERDVSQMDLKGIKAIVLKPALLGGFDATARFIRIAKDNNIMSVLSSSFESGVGIRSIALFAAKIGPGNIAAGLDTLKWFAEDVLKENVKIEIGSIDIFKLSKPSLRMDILTKL